MDQLVIISKDERLADSIQDWISRHYTALAVAGVACESRAAEELIISRRPDLVLLDLDMDTGKGMLLLELCHSLGSRLIVFSESDCYTLKMIRYSTLDYLLKPFQPEALQQGFTRFHHGAPTRPIDTHFRLHRQQGQLSNFEVLTFYLDSSICFVPVSAILSLRCGRRRTRARLQNGTSLLAEGGGRRYRNLIPPHLCLPVAPREFILAPHVLSFCEAGSPGLLLKNEEFVRILPAFLGKFKKAWQDYQKKSDER